VAARAGFEPADDAGVFAAAVLSRGVGAGGAAGLAAGAATGFNDEPRSRAAVGQPGVSGPVSAGVANCRELRGRRDYGRKGTQELRDAVGQPIAARRDCAGQAAGFAVPFAAVDLRVAADRDAVSAARGRVDL